MLDFSITHWASNAMRALPESHHGAVKIMARYAMEYRTGNRLLRNRRPSVKIARPMEVPYGHYIHAVNGTLKEDDAFLDQLQFIYNLGWASELDRYSLVLTEGVKHEPVRAAPALRDRAGIPRRVRRLVFENDSNTCWLCGFETQRPTNDDWLYLWSPTLDHVTPHSQGGSDSIENLRTAHRWCNSARGNRGFSKQIMHARVNCQLSAKVATPYGAGIQLNKLINTALSQ